MKASVIICTRNRVYNLFALFSSLVQQTEKPYEIIIIDSSDVPLIEIDMFQNSVYTLPGTYIYKHTKPGLTYQRNVGVDCATGDLIYFFDDDVVLEPEYLERMNALFQKYPEYAGGMGSIKNISAYYYSWHRMVRCVFLLQRDYASGMFTWSGMPTHAYGTEVFKKVEVLGGCCCVYRAWIFKEFLFDESLHGYAYMEDCDFSRRVSYTYPLFFNTSAHLYHYASPLARDVVEKNRAMYIYNYTYLFFKNFYPQNRIKLVCYVWSILGLFVEALLLRNYQYIKGYINGLKSYINKCIST